MEKDYRQLLTKAGRLYERHEAGRPAPFKDAQKFFVQWRIEVVGDDESALVNTGYRLLVLDRYKTRDGSTRPRDDDIFSGSSFSQQSGEMGLGLVNASLIHESLR